MKRTYSVLLVCMGNICRSPTAEAVLRRLVEERGLADRVRIDSAGTSGSHVGSAPDPRAQAAAARRGYDLSQQRARQVTVDDCRAFDLVVAMDGDNLARLRRLCPEAPLRRLLEFAPQTGKEDVPDPYYGGNHGFEHVLNLVEAAARGLLAEIEAELDRVA